MRTHHYRTSLIWTGNIGEGTSSYAGYGRDHTITSGDKPPLLASADPAFRGDPLKWNPEDLLVASTSACHELTYLALCAMNGVTVLAYADDAEGEMSEERGTGRFDKIVLRPRVTIAAGSDHALAVSLHRKAHEQCFVANSLNFDVTCEAEVVRG